jgi:hypothetical protein
MSNITLNCLVLGYIPPEECVFLINISAGKTVFDLKKIIKTEKTNDFANIDADKLKLWKVNIPLYTPNKKLNALRSDQNVDIKEVLDGEILFPVSKICKAFPKELSDEYIHVIIQRPVNIVSFQWKK